MAITKDEPNRTKNRVTALIVKSGKILLIHRKKKGVEFFILPGGGVEIGESFEEAVQREVKEETNLKCTSTKLAFYDYYNDEADQPFFWCDVEEGEPKLVGGPEQKRHGEANWYNPEWIEISNVSQINLLPENIKKRLIKDLKQ